VNVAVTSIQKTFGDRLLALLNERGLSKSDLARHLNVLPSTVSRYTNGRVPEAETLDRIARFFGVTVDYLLGRTNDRQGTARAIPEQVPDDELYIVWRGKPQQLSPEYKKVLIDMMEAANRRLREEQEKKK